MGAVVACHERNGADEDVRAPRRIHAERPANHGRIGAHGARPLVGRQAGVEAVVLVVEPDDGGFRRRLVLRHVAQEGLLVLQRLPSAGGVARDPLPDERRGTEYRVLAGLPPITQHYPVVHAVETQQALNFRGQRPGADTAKIVADHEKSIGLPAQHDIQVHRPILPHRFSPENSRGLLRAGFRLTEFA
jgi:hypothetical protein